MASELQIMLDYQRQESPQSLAEGIAEYFSAFAGNFGDRKLSDEATEFFRCHDVAHVVFGCDISLSDEAVVKVSSMFGTTAGFGVLRGYRLAESKEIYTELKTLDILRTTTKSLVIVPRAIWRCTRMHKRWPWDDFDDHLDMPLKKIRSHFGIRVAH